MKHNREKQADVLRRTQAKNRENKKEQALKAIQEIRDEAEPNGQKTPESVDSTSSMNSDSVICIQQVPKERLSSDNLQKLKSKFIKENE